ncbi:uncharacterized protein LOC116918213 isoform X2 [Daphnia magna]|uniref:uncharacterized protein LOC116918213 isoform X2 n=1 Tax=Daphnia magna TaxID=35525 RepID=UPI001403D368|nr:uncharacterized protein LOC116918213 isoform X2 [Daphnia magna]
MQRQQNKHQQTNQQTLLFARQAPTASTVVEDETAIRRTTKAKRLRQSKTWMTNESSSLSSNTTVLTSYREPPGAYGFATETQEIESLHSATTDKANISAILAEFDAWCETTSESIVGSVAETSSTTSRAGISRQLITATAALPPTPPTSFTAKTSEQNTTVFRPALPNTKLPEIKNNLLQPDQLITATAAAGIINLHENVLKLKKVNTIPAGAVPIRLVSRKQL